MKNKTLEAWVQLDTLDQRGGGVVTLQDQRGVVFDSIVFAESAPNEWLAGSDNHKRTKPFDGPPDTEAAQRVIHIAMTYEDAQVACYRDGKLYGKPIDSETIATFKPSESVILLGCRHGSSQGNKGLHGRILRARLYDRALSSAEIALTRTLEASSVSESDILAALTTEQKQQVEQWQSELGGLGKQISVLSEQLTRARPEVAGWESLALSLVNMKEFVYLR